jgi:hypothetical protein
MQMLTNTTNLRGFAIRTRDGELGTVEDFYFDDETWAIRYLTVETGGWHGGRQVLISPISVIDTDWQERQLTVALTKKKVENSPDIDTQQPVSRQHEADFFGYYGYPYYWAGPYMWGPAFYPAGVVALPTTSTEAIADSKRKESADSHLRSTKAVMGDHIEAVDGEIGHVDGFLVDDEAWAIRYNRGGNAELLAGEEGAAFPSVAGTSELDGFQRLRWPLPGSHQERSGVLEPTRITREYEDRLYLHYGRPPYWAQGLGHRPCLALSGV